MARWFLAVPFIIDNGSATSKDGVAGDLEPYADFRSVIVRPIQEEKISIVYFGQEAIYKKGQLPLILLSTALSKIGINELRYPDEHPVLLSEVSLNPMTNRGRLTHIMFDIFHVPVLHVGLQAVLVLLYTRDVPTTILLFAWM